MDEAKRSRSSKAWKRSSEPEHARVESGPTNNQAQVQADVYDAMADEAAAQARALGVPA